MQRDAHSRLDRLEARQREVTLEAEMDRYLVFVADVDGLTPSEAQKLRANAMAAALDPQSQPATDDEISHASAQFDKMLAWEQEAMR